MQYLDTSVVVASLTNEVASGSVRAWLTAQSAGSVLISDWVVTEVSSALSMKIRTGALPIERRSTKLAYFRQIVGESLTLLPVTPPHFHTAALLADQHHLGLRAGDALHLAIASGVGARLCTLDRRLANAATEIGASVLLLS